MAKIWATIVATTPFTDSHSDTSIGLNANIAGSTSDAKSFCTLELVKDIPNNWYNIVVTHDASIPYIENTSMGPINRTWFFEHDSTTFINVISAADDDKMIPTLSSPTSTVVSIVIPDGTTQLQVEFLYTCNLNHINREDILDVVTSET